MKRLFQLLLLFIMFLVPIAVLGAESTKFYTITCNPGEDSNTEMRINWHTDAGVTDSYVLYTKKSDANWDNAIKAETTSIQNDAFTQLNASGSVLTQNGAVLSNLEPDTQYMYKVTDGTEYLEGDGYVAFDLFVMNLSGDAYYEENNTANEEAIYLATDLGRYDEKYIKAVLYYEDIRILREQKKHMGDIIAANQAELESVQQIYAAHKQGGAVKTQGVKSTTSQVDELIQKLEKAKSVLAALNRAGRY